MGIFPLLLTRHSPGRLYGQETHSMAWRFLVANDFRYDGIETPAPVAVTVNDFVEATPAQTPQRQSNGRLPPGQRATAGPRAMIWRNGVDAKNPAVVATPSPVLPAENPQAVVQPQHPDFKANVVNNPAYAKADADRRRQAEDQRRAAGD